MRSRCSRSGRGSLPAVMTSRSRRGSGGASTSRRRACGSSPHPSTRSSRRASSRSSPTRRSSSPPRRRARRWSRSSPTSSCTTSSRSRRRWPPSLRACPSATLIPHVHPSNADGAPPYALGARYPRTRVGQALWRSMSHPVEAGLRRGRSELNETRARLGLRPVTRLFGGISERLCLVGTFPQLEYPRAWPEHVKVVGSADLGAAVWRCRGAAGRCAARADRAVDSPGPGASTAAGGAARTRW